MLNICWLFYALAQFLFTTSEMELDYCHQNENIRVASQIAEHLNFKKILEMLGIDGKYPAGYQKGKL